MILFSFYHINMSEFHESIIPVLQEAVPQTIQRICPWGEATPWSVVYRLDLLNGTHLFVKGTPRQRHEALVTQHLSSLYPTGVPHVLIADLLPTASWRWFLLEDVGGSPPTTLRVPQAVDVARTLGWLQRRTEHDSVLPSLLSNCSAHHLHAQVLVVCQWALVEKTLSWRSTLYDVFNILGQAHVAFGDLAEALAGVPATIIHGDMWAGNLVLTDHGVRFLDWGDALWGVGGTSLVRLFLSQPDLKQAASVLWEAYQQGRGITLSQEYRRACEVALDVVDLVGDQAIAKSCGQGPTSLPSLLPGLQRIAAWVQCSRVSEAKHVFLQ